MLRDKVKEFYKKEGEKDPYHKLEFKTTLHFLNKHLPEEGLILDAGGGPGRYTIELAKEGYEVVLLDLSSELLKIAREKIKGKGVEKQVKEIIEGSIDDLHMFKAGEFDAVICLGNVLGHVVEEKDRKKAIKEMKRVTKSESPLFISVTGRLAVLERVLADYPEELTEPHFKKYRDTGRYEGTHGFTASHFYMLEELVEELKEEGLNVVEKIGLEGLATGHREETNELYEEDKEKWRIWWNTHLKTCTFDSVANTSEHFMVICKKDNT